MEMNEGTQDVLASVYGEVRREHEARIAAGEPVAATIVNLTPHDVTLVEGSYAPIRIKVFPSAGEVRAEAERVEVGRVRVYEDGTLPLHLVEVPVYEVQFGRVKLPDLAPGTLYIVSRIAAEAIRAQGGSTDNLLIPDDLVRSPGGQPIGCRSFAKLA
jgi:hypothetical protein